MFKKIGLMALATCALISTQAQTDTTQSPVKESDTMRIGNIIILKNGQPSNQSQEVQDYFKNRKYHRKSNHVSHWFALDLGFNNFVDNTDYSSPEAQAFGGTDINEDWFNLRNSKSINVNLWFVQGRLNMIKHVINLRYGAGLEFYNFRFEEDIRFRKTLLLFIWMKRSITTRINWH